MGSTLDVKHFFLTLQIPPDESVTGKMPEGSFSDVRFIAYTLKHSLPTFLFSARCSLTI